MKIKKELIKIIMFALILIISLEVKTFASTLTLNVTTDKDNYKVSEMIDVTVDWKENMQATSFKIGYDSEKLEFVLASIHENFYNSKNAGEISINWASLEGTDLTQIKFQFKAIKDGQTNVRIKEVAAFADGDLVSPTSYDFSTYGEKTITIESKDGTGNTEDPSDNQKPNDENKDPVDKGDNSQAPNPIPEAGIKITVLLTIIITGILSIIFFIKNKEFSDI